MPLTESTDQLTYDNLIDTIPVGGLMEVVKVSPKYQIVIPKRVRDLLEIRPGEELQVYVLDGSMRFRKRRPISELRGMAKGMRWKEEDRDHTDRF